MSSHPLVSVIVTTKNEERRLKQCLESIKKQTYNPIELIVVDNNSTDNTLQIARIYTSHIFTHGPERSAQRNFGASQATGKYYLYLDADMSLSQNCIKEFVNLFEKDSTIKGMYIPEIIQGHGFWLEVRKFERSFYNATCIDCVRAVRLADFKAVEGFDESLTGPEDWDFDKKIRGRGKTAITQSPLFHDESDFKINSYVNKKKYYAQSFDQYIKKWGRNDPDITKQFSPYYRFIGVFIEDGKWKKIIQHPHLMIGIFILRFLVGLQYIRRNT